MRTSSKRRFATLVVTAVTAFAMSATAAPASHADPSERTSQKVAAQKPASKAPQKKTTREVRGAPVDTTPKTVTQPDGSKVTIQRNGDRLRNWTSTIKGNATVVKDRQGYWRYASGLDSKGQPKAGSKKAAASAAVPQESVGLTPTQDLQEAATVQQPLGFTGTQRTLVILAQFSDRSSLGTTAAQWSSKFFAGTGSVRSFYKGASFNKLDVAPAQESSGAANDGVVGWVTLPMSHPDSTRTNAGDREVAAAAITAADPYIDYASYDTNGDGAIQPNELHVTVIAAGYEGSVGNPCGVSVWGHQWSVPVSMTQPVDGTYVGTNGYTEFGEMHCEKEYPAQSRMATIGIMAHEFGHDLGWVDLYDISQKSEGLGIWSLMAGGSWGTKPGGMPGDTPTLPDAYSKYLQGWIAPTAVNSLANVSVPQASTNPSAFRLLADPDGPGVGSKGEYFLVENRQQSDLDGGLSGCGLLVYHVKEAYQDNVRTPYGQLIDIEEADGDEDYFSSPGDPFHGLAGRTSFNATSVPNSKAYNGQDAGVRVTTTSGCSASMPATMAATGTLSVTPPANDTFAAAKALTPATAGTWKQGTVDASIQAGEPRHADAVGGNSVWFNWTAPSAGKLTVATANTTFDSTLAVYTGGAVNALTRIAANDDVDAANGVFTSKLSNVPVTAGTTYRIAVDSWYGAPGALDLQWSFTPAATSSFVSLAPSRILDTRYGTGAPKAVVPANGKVDLQVTGRGGVPPNASSVVLNVTAVSPKANGWVTVWPAGATKPTASNLNFVTGQTVPNLVIAKVGNGGKVSLSTSAGTHLLADVAGYYSTGSAYTGVNPTRVMDTRYGTGAPKVRIPAGGSVTIAVGGTHGVSATASAAILNITSVNPSAAGTVTAFPAGVATPAATSISFRKGQTIAGLGIVKLGTGGKVTLRSTASTDLVVDLNGWVPAGADTVAFTPTRLLGSRATAAGTAFQVKVAGVAGVPSNAKAVQVTVTSVNPSQAGYLTVWPTGVARPTVSNLNYTPGGSISNSAIVKVGTGGTITVFASGKTPVTIDTSAYFA